MPTRSRLSSELTRRGFLGSLGVAALTLSGSVPSGKGAGPGPPLACRLASYGVFEDVAWTHLPALGIRHVFLNVPEPADVPATIARLEKHGLAPLVLRGSADLSQGASVDVLARQAATCRRMGVDYMFLSPKHGDAPREVAWERLRKAGDAVASHGVTIALETHPDLGTNADVHLETMQAIAHPNVRVNFDTGNITYYNHGRNAVDELKKIIDYVATVELKDHNGGYETWVFPPLGQGIVDLPGVLRVLANHPYAGPVTLEFEGTKGVELSEAQTKAAIEESIQYIRSISDFT